MYGEMVMNDGDVRVMMVNSSRRRDDGIVTKYDGETRGMFAPPEAVNMPFTDDF